MRCPVCPSASIGRTDLSCGNCGADLAPIRRLQELPALCYNQALVLLRRGEAEQAITRLRFALAVDEHAPHARRLLGKALWNVGRTAEAVDQWRLAPDDEGARRCLEMATASAAARAPRTASLTTLVLVSVGAMAAGALIHALV